MSIKKATLVLEGGATRGVFTSGVLDLLMEKEIYTSHVIGVSAGACNALSYVSRQPGRTRDCMIPKEKDLGYYYGIRDFVKEKSIMNMDMIFDRYPKEIYPFDFDTYFKCRASCSMPLLTPIVNVDGVPYLDGGLADSVPIRRAESMENEKIVVVLTKNAGYRKQTVSKGMQKIYRRAYRSYPALIRTIFRRSFEYNKTMNYLDQLEKKGKVFVIRPQVKPVSRLERNTETLHAFYEHGYKLMERKLDALMEYLGK